MEIIRNKYISYCDPSNVESIDIYEHLPIIYKYASSCESIIELGVRGNVSSWASVYGLLNNNSVTKKILFNDINVNDINDLFIATENLNVDIQYQWINDLDIVITENVDMTCINTWHVYGQLKRELDKFSVVTNKYIIIHATTIDEFQGETIRNNWNAVNQSQLTGFPIAEINAGLGKAIDDFLILNPQWKLLEKFTNNNGLTILERILS